jgi:hypothetical protein
VSVPQAEVNRSEYAPRQIEAERREEVEGLVKPEVRPRLGLVASSNMYRKNNKYNHYESPRGRRHGIDMALTIKESL